MYEDRVLSCVLNKESNNTQVMYMCLYMYIRDLDTF